MSCTICHLEGYYSVCKPGRTFAYNCNIDVTNVGPPPCLSQVRCTTHGPSFARLRYINYITMLMLCSVNVAAHWHCFEFHCPLSFSVCITQIGQQSCMHAYNMILLSWVYCRYTVGATNQGWLLLKFNTYLHQYLLIVK